jgi:hypothetical protein
MVKASDSKGGGTFWGSAKIIRRVDASLQESIQAVRVALESLEFEITKEATANNEAQFITNYTDGKTAWIEVRRIDESKSYIGVRVGMVSDENAAVTILDAVEEQL